MSQRERRCIASQISDKIKSRGTIVHVAPLNEKVTLTVVEQAKRGIS